MGKKLALLGSGGIGSTAAAYLSRAGQDITIIDMWPQHVDRMKTNGLTVKTVEDEFSVPVKAVHVGEVATLKDQFDIVFLCVKSYDTLWSVQLILPYLAPAGVIVSAQNGINEDIIAPTIGYSRTIGCVVTLGARMIGPAHVTRTSPLTSPVFILGELSGVTTSRVKEIASILSAVGKTAVTTNLWDERWSKLAVNCMVNPVAGLSGLKAVGLGQSDEAMTTSIQIAREVITVGIAQGIRIESIRGIASELFEQANNHDTISKIKNLMRKDAQGLGDAQASLLTDILQGRRTEVDHLNGYVARKGNELGVPTPMNESITKLIHRIERGEMRPDIDNFKYL